MPSVLSTAAPHGALSGGPTRVRAIDGLRGLAALAVVAFHAEAVRYHTPTWSPAVRAVMGHGFLGVEVFFVLSGFVIAMSVAGHTHSLGFLGRFAARRVLRLDPPYWLAVVMELALIAVTVRVLPDYQPIPVTPGSVVAHLTYTQDLFGYAPLSDTFWTLCFEVQFYLSFVAALVGLRWLGRRTRPEVAQWAGVALFAGAFALSLAMRFHVVPWDVRGLALPRWYQFGLGVLAFHASRPTADLRPLGAGLVAVLATLVAAHADWTQGVVVGTACWLLTIVRYGRGVRLLEWRPVVWLGSISYSLYLFHQMLSWRLVKLVAMVVPAPWPVSFAWGVFVLDVLACLVFAWVVWRAVEAPAQRWSKRVPLVARPAARETPSEERLRAVG